MAQAEKDDNDIENDGQEINLNCILQSKNFLPTLKFKFAAVFLFQQKVLL
jgi:hypothetical protein